MVGFCGAMNVGARPGRSDDGQDGGIGRHGTPRMGTRLGGKTDEHRGVGDHVC